MSEDPKTQTIDGHVFDIDGNPIDAHLVIKRIEVDTEPCISASGAGWLADRPGGLINRADDVQFCVPLSAVPEPGVWTVVGIYEDATEPYPDGTDPQPQRWADVVAAESAVEAVQKARESLEGRGATVIIAACLAGDVQVVA